VSLWYTVGDEFAHGDADSVLIASEPLTRDTSGWLEVPEYTMLTADLAPGRLDVRTLDLDV
jgi:glutamine amidotransferase